MKKLYLSLLLATNVAFVSCMEKEWPQPIPVYTNSVTMSHPYTTHNQYALQQPIYCEANQPGWEFYDDIANVTYNEIPLTPIYKPANTNVVQKEKKINTTLTQKDVEWLLQDKDVHTTLTQTHKKWLFKSNSLQQPDKDIMQKLYDQASNIIIRHQRGATRHSHKHEEQQFIQIIKDMNSAKQNGINEDLMGEFTYKKSYYYYEPIVFMLLKKYNTTVHTTGEKLPTHPSSKKPCLKEILNTSNNTNTKTITTNTIDTHDIITQYPAFFQLIYTLSDVAQEQLFDYPMTIFMDYVYENNNILLEDYSDGSYKDFKNEFYSKAYDMFQAFLSESGVNCYNLVQMIDKAKEVGDIHNEDDLINHMAHYTAPQSLGTQIQSLFNSSHTDTERKRIIIFCKLVKIYNNKRGFKMTPTIKQYQAYSVKKALDISLPEHLSNRDLFDENSYAFEEIADLTDATNVLKKASADEINELLKKTKK